MRRAFVLASFELVLCFGLTLGQNTPALTQNPSGPRTYYVTGSPWPNPKTFAELKAAAVLIVDGTVVQSLPARRFIADQPHTLETDVLVSVDQVLKGSVPVQRTIMVSQIGGVQPGVQVIAEHDVLMLPSERYVLFLIAEDRANLPMIAGVPRYSVIAGSSGKFLVDNGRIRILSTRPIPAQTQFSGVSVDSLLTAIRMTN